MTKQKNSPEQILDKAYRQALTNKGQSFITKKAIKDNVEFVSRCLGNRACVRLLLSCTLAKIDNPKINPQKPYTEIKGDDCFSGRTYDEKYITPFINRYKLPVNLTTAFLTPALRNINRPLTKETKLEGKPRELYNKALSLLDDLAENKVSADLLLKEIIRHLILMKQENIERIKLLKKDLKDSESILPLSSECIITLIKQHLECKNSSRLPVLIVTAAYKSIENIIGEKALPLRSHLAADSQTGALGDIEICLINDDAIVTVYEMKMEKVTTDDIDVAIKKISKSKNRIDNYLFITTDDIVPSVSEYAARIYEETGGTEIAILDCIGFLRSFLHLFHRHRITFLETYQELVLSEPDSAVKQALKEVFLSLRKTAETDG